MLFRTKWHFVTPNLRSQLWPPQHLRGPTLVAKTSDCREASTRSPLRRRRSFYTASEDDILVQGRSKGQSWATIASQLDRSLASVRNRFFGHLLEGQLRKDPQRAGRFTPAEDRFIQCAMHKEDTSFREIALGLGRSRYSIMTRYRYHLKSQSHDVKLKRTRFNTTEDRDLLRMRDEDRALFSDIARQLQRPVRLVIDRYYRISIPDQGSHRVFRRYTKAEDDRLIDLRSSKGPMWRVIAMEMPGRTFPSVRARYYYLRDRRRVPEAAG